MHSRELTLKTRTFKLALKIWGAEADKPVLALHGWMDNAGSFDVLAPQLAGVRTIAIDLPGHGRSSHRSADAAYYIWSYLPDVLDVARHLELETFSLLGHSMGGGLACLLSALYPERVRRLVLLDSIGPLATPAEAAPEQMHRALNCQRLARPLRHYSGTVQAERSRARRGVRMETAHILGLRGLGRDEKGYFWNTDRRLRLPNQMSMTEAQVAAFMRQIQCPVQLITAAQYWQQRQELLQLRISYLDKLSVISLHGSHYQHLEEQSGEIAGHLEQFLLN